MSKKISAIDLRPGFIIDHEKSIWRVISSESSGTGRGANYTKVLLRDLNRGCNKEVRLNPEVKISLCTLESIEYSPSHEDGSEIVCFDESGVESYFAKKYMDEDLIPLILDAEIENTKIVVNYLDDKIFKISLPKKIVVRVVETEPYIKKQTASASYKPAILANGWKIMVPQFIEECEKIIIDSETKEYSSRFAPE